MSLAYFFVFIFGTVVGSFLNVVILRGNTGSSLFGRSRCFTCGMQLRWFDLVPLLSFCVLRGTCRLCRSSISWQYFTVEFITGALFLGTFWKIASFYKNIQAGISETTFLAQLPWASIVFYWVMWSILVVIAIYDIRHKMIPDGYVYGLALLALVQITTEVLALNGSLSGALQSVSIGPLFAVPFFLIWFFSRGRAMGFGDVKLAIALGLLLSLPQSLAVFMLAFWFGGAMGILLLLASWLRQLFHVKKKPLSSLTKSVTIKSEIPFAPFLILGVAAVFFCNVDIYILVSLFEQLWM